MKNVKVADFMERDPVSAHPEMPLAELVRLLWRERVRALPVVDAEGRLLGVVSETDLFLKEKGVPFSLEKVTTLLGEPLAKGPLEGLGLAGRVAVADVMSDHPVAIAADTTLEESALLMHERRLSVLPVVEGERLIGMVRRIYLLRRIYGAQPVAV